MANGVGKKKSQSASLPQRVCKGCRLLLATTEPHDWFASTRPFRSAAMACLAYIDVIHAALNSSMYWSPVVPGVTLMELLEALGRYLPHATAMFIRGSRAEGFAGAKADIDAIVVTEEPSRFEPNQQGFDIYHWHGVYVEVLVLNEADLHLRLSVLEKPRLSQVEFDGAERILSARLLHGDPSRFDFEARQEAFNAKYIESRMERCRNLFAKIKSEFTAADYQLLNLCRRFTLSMLEAYLVSKGDTFTRERWLFKRLDRTLGKDAWIVRRYIQLLFQQACLTPHEVQANARQLLLLAQAMQYAMLTGEHDSPVLEGGGEQDEPAFLIPLSPEKSAIIYLNGGKVGTASACLDFFRQHVCGVAMD
ncbi:hypothetical protein GIV17_23765 [Pseudomonas syringae]|nr:hypothetical protein [Pseudomonas syringae]MCF5742671.1 hypothetical protein [Pseudomonas syringae]MCF5753020.1 hypothetical protein [Pseudomonas syringae]MCF5757723.1 hypothetical protein [Pseudomonas syringae]